MTNVRDRKMELSHGAKMGVGQLENSDLGPVFTSVSELHV
jgi:hypothetical protein